MSPRLFSNPKEALEIGRLWVVNADDRTPRVIIGDRVLTLNGDEEPFEVPGVNDDGTDGLLTVNRDGDGAIVLTYRRELSTEMAIQNPGKVEETIIILHATDGDTKGFTVIGPDLVPAGFDLFTTALSVIGGILLIMTALAALSVFGGYINGY